MPRGNTLNKIYRIQLRCSVWFFHPREQNGHCPFMPLGYELGLAIKYKPVDGSMSHIFHWIHVHGIKLGIPMSHE